MVEKKRLYVREQTAWHQACSSHRRSIRQLEVQELPEGILLPPDNWNPQTGEYQGGVCDRDGNFVAGLIRGKPPQAGFYGVSSAYSIPDAQQLAYVDKDVIFGGILIGHFGHFILESLGRLWYVAGQAASVKPLVFLTELKICSWYWSFFDLLGIDRKRIILLQRPTRFRSIIVPEEAVHSWYDYTKEYLIPYQLIVQQACRKTGNKSLGKKIFLSRRGIKNNLNKCINEEYFVNFFARQGFVAVELEKLPLPEQVSIVANAEEIAAVLGSLTHWAMFCRPGTKFTMLTRTSDEVLVPQCIINVASQVDWYIVDTAMSLFYANRSAGVCLIGPTVYWQEYARDHYGQWLDDGSWKQAYHEYLREWTDYVLQAERWEVVKNLDALAMLTHLNQNLHKNETMLAAADGSPLIAKLLLADVDYLYIWTEEDRCLRRLDLSKCKAEVIYHRLEQDAPAPLYGAMVEAGSHLVLVPENTQFILDYDRESGALEEIPLPHALPRGNSRYAVAYEEMVIMIGYRYEAILAYNPVSKGVGCLLSLSAVLQDIQGENYKDHSPWGGKPCLLGDKLYVPVIDMNKVLELDLRDNSSIIHQVGSPEAAYGFAAAYAGNIWLAPSQGGPMAVWNPPADVMRIFNDFSPDYSFARVNGEIRFFADIVICGACLWLLPWGGSQLLYLNMETGKIAVVPIKLPEALPHVYSGCAKGKRVYISDCEGQIHCLDGDSCGELSVFRIS